MQDKIYKQLIEDRITSFLSLLNEATMSLEQALKIFNLSSKPDVVSLNKIYKTLAMKMHPDQGGSEEDMKNLNIAYSILKSPIDSTKTSYSAKETTFEKDYREWGEQDKAAKDQSPEANAWRKYNNDMYNTAKMNMEHAGKMYHLAKTPEEQNKLQKEYYAMKIGMEKYQKGYYMPRPDGWKHSQTGQAFDISDITKKMSDNLKKASMDATISWDSKIAPQYRAKTL